ncbi:hypothetical protein ISCGN_013736 [Ixodes scapularis]
MPLYLHIRKPQYTQLVPRQRRPHQPKTLPLQPPVQSSLRNPDRLLDAVSKPPFGCSAGHCLKPQYTQLVPRTPAPQLETLPLQLPVLCPSQKADKLLDANPGYSAGPTTTPAPQPEALPFTATIKVTVVPLDLVLQAGLNDRGPPEARHCPTVTTKHQETQWEVLALEDHSYFFKESRKPAIALKMSASDIMFYTCLKAKSTLAKLAWTC